MSEMRGITFIDIVSGASKHTADDWDLIMSAKAIGSPPPRYYKVDMPDRDGDLDQTEVMRGRVSYGNRALSFAFICTAHHSTWADLRSEIAGYIHGKRLKVVDPDTPNHYYIGRCELQEPTYKGEAIMFLTVTVDAHPYRMSNTETTVTETVSAGDTMRLINDIRPVVPLITVDADMTIQFGNFSSSLASGSVNMIPEITLENGTNTITIISGSGTITFTYRQGAI